MQLPTDKIVKSINMDETDAPGAQSRVRVRFVTHEPSVGAMRVGTHRLRKAVQETGSIHVVGPDRTGGRGA